jgi:hypothetical protein
MGNAKIDSTATVDGETPVVPAQAGPIEADGRWFGL